MTTYTFTALYNRIEEILWKYWDPTGINHLQSRRNEYKNYTPHIFRLQTDKAGKEAIANKLLEIEIHMMGLPGGSERCNQAAERIDRLKQFTVL